MKIALCFSGQCRHLERFDDNFEKNLLTPLEPMAEIHTFYHFWREGIDARGVHFQERPIAAINATLSPTDYLIDDQLPFPSTRINPHTASMFYSIRQANSLKRQHEHEYDMTFDAVIRMRLDLPIKERFNLDVLADLEDYIYVRPFHQDVAHDIFAIGNSKNMDTYARCYDEIATGRYHDLLSDPEQLLTRHLQDAGLSWKSLGIGFM